MYLFSKWLTPGELLFSAFRKLPLEYANNFIITGYTFYQQSPSFETYYLKDTKDIYSNNL